MSMNTGAGDTGDGIGKSAVETLDRILARNLTAARVGTRTTQQDLADVARISRATIAQLESGVSDPRISTIERLAGALQVPVFALLASDAELVALSRAAAAGVERAGVGPKERLAGELLHRLGRLAGSGDGKDRLRAARLAAELAAEGGDASARAASLAAVLAPALGGAWGRAWGGVGGGVGDVADGVLAALVLAGLLRQR